MNYLIAALAGLISGVMISLTHTVYSYNKAMERHVKLPWRYGRPQMMFGMVTFSAFYRGAWCAIIGTALYAAVHAFF